MTSAAALNSNSQVPDVEIVVLTGADLQGHTTLRDEVFEALRGSYVDLAPLLDVEFRRNDTAYLVLDSARSILAFFMVGWGTVSSAGYDIQTVYLGLSGTRPDQRKSGYRQRLLERFVSDAQRWEEVHGDRLLLWGITGTPSSFLAVHKAFSDVSPVFDGAYSPEYLMPVRLIREKLGAPADWGDDHPFVLRNLSAYRYSEQESAVIQATYSRPETFIFRDLRINEAVGDRLLLICRVPTPPPML